MEFFWHVLFLIANWIPTSQAYNLILGKGKILHFGPLAIVLVSAYGTFVTFKATESWLLGISVGLFAAMGISLLFAWLSLRLPTDSFGILSIAVHLAVLAIVLNWTDLTRGALGIPGIPNIPFLDTLPKIAIAMTVIAVLWLAAMFVVHRSTIGRQLSALAEHEWHAKSLGVNKQKIHVIVFLIGAVGATLVTTMYIPYVHLLHPNDYLYPALIMYVMFIVAGNPGSIFGVTLSVSLLILLKEALRFVPLAPAVLGPIRLMLFGFILFVAVWFRRETLFPQQRKI